MLSELVTAVELDPAAVRPSPLSLVVFLFLAGSLALLLWSMLRHMRRARVNLGTTSAAPPVGPSSQPGPAGGAARGDDPSRA